MSTRRYSALKLGAVLVGLMLLLVSAVVTYDMLAPIRSGADLSSICPDGDPDGLGFSPLPPGYSCYYKDGRTVPMEVAQSRLATWLGATGLALIVAVIVASALSSRTGRRTR